MGAVWGDGGVSVAVRGFCTTVYIECTQQGYYRGSKMITYKEFKLDKKDFGITFSGTYGPETEIKNKFEDSDSVILKQGDIQIDVINVIKQEDQTYKGTVKNVWPCSSLESKSVVEGKKIQVINHAG
ncbi:hypothetical protein VU04_11730 [Desulfobulbus sp. TB]|nr:hypothetical protein [Desulfobulbus sp. TB]